MHWREGTPQINTVKDAIGHLSALGYTPGVMFDANAGYLLTGKYQHDGAFAKALGPAGRPRNGWFRRARPQTR